MKKYISKWIVAGGFATAVLAGCGGGGGDGPIVSNFGACTQSQTIPAEGVVAYIEPIIKFDENSQPIDISCRTLATDETLEPQPIM
jgi:hypothetical protein